jgi:pseudouridine-5'-phosphate glycosidase
LTPDLHIRPEVAAALDAGRAVVALESTVISHGLPHPHNLEIARRLEAIIRAAGAVPATVAILGGRICVGLDDTEIEHLATASAVAKVSRRDLGAVLARGGDGATTVAATMIAAALAGIRVFATGGIGGVHRGGEMSLDVSADLTELGRSPVAVVASGAKAILDLPRTLEVLETHGVPVIGYGPGQRARARRPGRDAVGRGGDHGRALGSGPLRRAPAVQPCSRNRRPGAGAGGGLG